MTALVESVNDELRAHAFSAWADVYDEPKNPLLTLEERFLQRLLPTVQCRDILDVGCGTGRWLVNLSRTQPDRLPRTLHGIDPSSEMLARAAAKNIPNAQLSLAPCDVLPVQGEAFDIVLVSFVLSYVDDLRSIAEELARVSRPGADLFLSDMHPITASSLHWKRSFRKGQDELEIPAITRTISDILTTFESNGFAVRAILEPSFGATEREIFAASQKLDRFAEAENLPAIYILHLSKTGASRSPSETPGRPVRARLLRGGRCALGPQEAVSASIGTRAGRIETVGSDSLASSTPPEARIDLTGYLVLPGLVNAHDHLEFSLFPRLGRGHYENAAQWAQDIQRKDATTIATHRKVSKHIRLWWGGIRNLLSGVTTVCHHNPIDPLLLSEEFPVHVLSRFGWEHSLSFAVDVHAAHQDTAADDPFVIHACEGIDALSKQELQKLDDLKVLGPQTVIVHGLALDQEGAASLRERGASLVICPSSNTFLFGKAPSIEILETISQVALGSDSPLTAAGDLLDEIQFAIANCGISPQRLYSMVTSSAASVLRLKEGEGSIRPGARADLIAVRDRKGDPAEILCSIAASDIELVLLSNRVQLASPAVFERLALEDRKGLEPLSIDGDVRWLRAPVDYLLSEVESVLGEGTVRLGGKSGCRPSW